MKFKVGSNKIQRNKGITSFSNILPDVVEKYEMKDSFNIEKLKEAWSFIVGDLMATHSYPDRFFKHTLFIIADHSVYSNELMILKSKILKKLKDRFPNNPFGNMRVEIKKSKWR